MLAPFRCKLAVNVEVKPVPCVCIRAFAAGKEIEAQKLARVGGNGR